MLNKTLNKTKHIFKMKEAGGMLNMFLFLLGLIMDITHKKKSNFELKAVELFYMLIFYSVKTLKTKFCEYFVYLISKAVDTTGNYSKQLLA